MKKISSARYITICAMLTALCVVLDRLSAMNEFFKVGLGFVPVVIAAILYGPATSALVYGLADFIAANLFPKGAYFPGFTLSAILMGAIYGLFLYEWKKSTVPGEKHGGWVKVALRYLYRVVTPTLLCSAVGMFLTTYWITILYGKNTYWANFQLRLTQFAIFIPLNLVLIPALIHLCAKLQKFTAKRVK
jgi:ECF transporter S component (folate family)